MVDSNVCLRFEGGAGVGKTFTVLLALAVRTYMSPYAVTIVAQTHRMVNNAFDGVRRMGARLAS